MTDRIKEPWGERTPFGPGEEWPVRVDQFLEQGLSEDDIDRWVQTASILHSNGDALDVAVKEGRIVGVRGRGVDRVNKGRVDPKDLFGWQAKNAGDRLRKPLVRENGQLVEASWDEALGRIGERSKELLEEKGPLAFGFYTTGQLFLEEYYTLGVIGKAGLGTPHMDGNTRLCTATAAEALKQSFGTDGQPGSYADVDHADAICLYGHNVAETQAVLWMRMLDRLEGPQPPKLVVVDPRPTPAAQTADVHLQVRNGTNMALMNGLLREIVVNDWFDAEYVAAHTLGFDALKQIVMEYPPERVAEICEVNSEQIREAACIIGESERLLSTVLQGFYQLMQATAASCQVNNIHLLRGMVGRPGCGVLQMNGQPTAQNNQPRCLPARAFPHTLDPQQRRPLCRRPGHLFDRDHPVRRRGVACCNLGREDRHFHERRSHSAPLGEGRRAAGRGKERPRYLPRLRPAHGFRGQRRAIPHKVNPEEPENLYHELFDETRSGGLGLLRDMQDLYLMANACDISWTMIGQAAQGVRDRELLETVNACEGQTATQIKWLKTRMKQAAPQALLVAS